MNKVIANTTEGGNPVHIDPVMLHFTKDEKKYWTDLGIFGQENLSTNSNLKNIRFIRVDLESAISTGLKTMTPCLRRLIYVHHLMKQEEIFFSKNRSKDRWQKTIFVESNKRYTGMKSWRLLRI